MSEEYNDRGDLLRLTLDAIRHLRADIELYTGLLKDEVSKLRRLDPKHPLLKELNFAGGKYVGLPPWIAANRELAERGEMPEKALIAALVEQGCALGKNPKGGPAAAVKGGLTQGVNFGYFVRHGKFIKRTPTAPAPGEERDED